MIPNPRDGAIERFRSHDTNYSDLVSVAGPGQLIFVAGQLAFDEDRNVISGGVTEQANRCLDIIEGLLAKRSAGLAEVVKITTYLTDLNSYPAFDDVRRQRFGDHRPASAAVGVAGLLFGALIEIEAVAFISADRI